MTIEQNILPAGEAAVTALFSAIAGHPVNLRELVNRDLPMTYRQELLNQVRRRTWLLQLAADDLTVDLSAVDAALADCHAKLRVLLLALADCTVKN